MLPDQIGIKRTNPNDEATVVLYAEEGENPDSVRALVTGKQKEEDYIRVDPALLVDLLAK